MNNGNHYAGYAPGSFSFYDDDPPVFITASVQEEDPVKDAQPEVVAQVEAEEHIEEKVALSLVEEPELEDLGTNNGPILTDYPLLALYLSQLKQTA